MGGRHPDQDRRAIRARRRAQVRRRRAVAIGALVLVLALAGYAVARLRSGGDPAAAGSSSRSMAASLGDPASSPPASTVTQQPKPTGTVTLSAVGDTILGYAGTLAPNPGSYFDDVKPQITGDIRFANLEGTLTDRTDGKCGANSTSCFEFRNPPSWAKYYRDAGWTIMSNANNHAFDFWQGGLDDTVAALDRAGLAHTGRTHEIAYVKVRHLTVAFIGVASYSNTGPLNDETAARQLIEQADRNADIVVVAMHAGAEGTAATHLTGQDEVYAGENRGNPEAFAHMAIDAGADLVIGYSPHVLRAMQVYRGRLIAYSLGNFAGYHNFTIEGPLGVSGILHVKLAASGAFMSGRLVSTRLVGAGQPVLDPGNEGAAEVEQLSRDDLGSKGAHLSASGVITP